MAPSRRLLAWVALVAAAAQPCGALLAGEPRTVCTATINSSDEVRMLRARLPAARFRFVELVEPARGDWLARACESRVRCDVLVVSGHFNAGDAFYSDRLERADFLAMDDLERAACTASCPLLAGVAEVYLFGCRSLHRDASNFASAPGEGGLARIRRIFAGVPAIYGFPGAAPLGPAAAASLARYFDAGGGARFGQGGIDTELLRAFPGNELARVAGAGPGEAAARERACRFHDADTTTADKLRYARTRLAEGASREEAHRIVALLESAHAAAERDPSVDAALTALGSDEGAQARYLALARAAGSAAERARMLALAGALGWLAPVERRDESAALAADLVAAGTPGIDEVAVACELAQSAGSVPTGTARAAASDPARTAILACLGDAAAGDEVLELLANGREDDVRIVQPALRRLLAADPARQRATLRRIVSMPAVPAQARALAAMARLPVTDPEALRGLEGAYAGATAPELREAIAEVFLRAGYRSASLGALVRAQRLARPRMGALEEALAASFPSS